MNRESNMVELCRKLGYEFQDPDLLAEALRHASYVNEVGDARLRDNERLEFLGDAVLDLAISHILMELFPDAKEGDLSKLRASVVNEKGLSMVAAELDLGSHLLLGKGEEHTGGRQKTSILADTLEALLGAIYMDGGFTKAMQIIRKLFLTYIEGLSSRSLDGDFKSLLQEFTQEAYKTRPEYELVGESGPPHQKIFTVALRIGGKFVAKGEGKSKKEAEQRAAKEAFFCLNKERRNR